MTGRLVRLLDHGLERLHGWLEARERGQFDAAPLCRSPLASAAEYRRVWDDARRQSYPVVDRYEEQCGAAIEPAWFHQLALLTQVPIKQSPIEHRGTSQADRATRPCAEAAQGRRSDGYFTVGLRNVSASLRPRLSLSGTGLFSRFISRSEN